MKSLGNTALIFSAIGAIPKYDMMSNYTLKLPEQLIYVRDKTKAIKSKQEVVMFIAENSEQDLSEAFHILSLACGVDPVFAAAIINEVDDNNCMKYILGSISH